MSNKRTGIFSSLLGVVLLCACAMPVLDTTAQSQRSLSNSDILFESSGTGETEEKARQAALRALATLLFVQVNAETSATTSVNRRGSDEVTQSSLSDDFSAVASLSAIGVMFSPARRLSGGKLEVTASLDVAAVRATITNLRNLADRNPKTLTPVERSNGVISARQLVSLLLSPGMKEVVSDWEETYHHAQERQKVWEQHTGNFGTLIFQLPDSFAAPPEDIALTINSQPYAYSPEIYLPPGNYRVSFTSPGHNVVTAKARIRTRKKERLRINIIPLPKETLTVLLQMDATLEPYRRDIETLLLDYNVIVSGSSGTQAKRNAPDDWLLALEATSESNEIIKGFPQRLVRVHASFARNAKVVSRETGEKRLALDSDDPVPARQWRIVIQDTLIALVASLSVQLETQGE